MGCQATHVVKSPTDWQTIVRNDLEAARRAIEEAHPGMIDDQNPSFRDWVKRGYEETLALVPGVIDYNSALSAIRYYTVGFEDGHLAYSDNVRPGDVYGYVTGWMIEPQAGRYVVVATAPQWKGALPPVGSVLTGCDGKITATLLHDLVRPFVDRRQLQNSQNKMPRAISNLHSNSMRLVRCEFTSADAIKVVIDVVYQPISFTDFFTWFVKANAHNSALANSFELKDDVLWVRAQNFVLNPESAKALEQMLEQLRAVKNVNVIVFDVQGNTGGDSGVGDRIFDAATGGFEYDQSNLESLSRTHALWRVSDIAINEWRRRLQEAMSAYGSEHTITRQYEAFLDELVRAKSVSKLTVEQEGGPRLTKREMEARSANLKRFKGKIALLADDGCASACLDFADMVRKVPGSIHVGQPTSADSVYIDVARVKMPSGNALILPLKVWRNRARANNEALIPDVKVELNNLDDASIQQTTLEAVRRQNK